MSARRHPSRIAAPVAGAFRQWSGVFTRRRVLLGLAVVIGIGLLAFSCRHLDFTALRRTIEHLPAGLFITSSCLLPMVGLPVSWLHLIAGARFGVLHGLAVVALMTLVHLVLGWVLVRVLPPAWFGRFDPWRERFDQAGHREATILCAILPGLPYTLHLYLLPLLGVPLRVIVGFNVPIHVARALVTLYLGDVADHPTAGNLSFIAVYYALMIGFGAWTARNLQRRLSGDATGCCSGAGSQG